MLDILDSFQSDTVQYLASSPSGLVDISFLYPGDQCIKEKVLLQLQPRSVRCSVVCCDVKMLNGAFIALLFCGAYTHTHTLSGMHAWGGREKS